MGDGDGDGVPAQLDVTGNYTTAKSTSYLPAATPLPEPDNRGSITESPNIVKFEMWLDSPNSNIGESLLKAGAGMVYGTVNDPVKLLTGTTVAGSPITPAQRQEAFVNTVPGLVLKAVSAVSAVEKTTQSMYTSFLKQEGRVSNAAAAKVSKAANESTNAVRTATNVTKHTTNISGTVKQVTDNGKKKPDNQ